MSMEKNLIVQWFGVSKRLFKNSARLIFLPVEDRRSFYEEAFDEFRDAMVNLSVAAIFLAGALISSVLMVLCMISSPLLAIGVLVKEKIEQRKELKC